MTITPTVENEGEAAYSWTIDDEVVSTARVFEYVFNEEGRVYVTLRVENRAGYDEKEARIDVNRLAPPVISLIVPPTGLYVLTGREYTFAPEVQNGENARYEWYLDDSSVPVSKMCIRDSLTKDPDKATEYLDYVVKSRDLTPFAERETGKITENNIINERRKEFFADGEDFFNMKRLQLDIAIPGGNFAGTDDATYTMPIPQSVEDNYRQ